MGEHLISTVTVPSMIPGNTEIADFEWEPVGEQQRIIIKVDDPINLIEEINEENNNAERELPDLHPLGIEVKK